jgi:hypothetical protein
MVAVNAEAHVRYWRGVYSSEGSEKGAKSI